MLQQCHFWVYICRKQNQYLKKIYIPMFIAELLIIAKPWQQPKHLLALFLESVVVLFLRLRICFCSFYLDYFQQPYLFFWTVSTSLLDTSV